MVGAAFDLIVHKILLWKLGTYGFNLSALYWIRRLVEHKRSSLMVVFLNQGW